MTNEPRISDWPDADPDTTLRALAAEYHRLDEAAGATASDADGDRQIARRISAAAATLNGVADVPARTLAGVAIKLAAVKHWDDGDLDHVRLESDAPDPTGRLLLSALADVERLAAG